MAFDYKKEYKEFYLPPAKPAIISIPPMNYIAVKGKGDPNEEDGEYKRSIGVLYTLAYTIKMSKLTDNRIDGYFDFVVPPLEGLWKNYGCDKKDFEFVSMIRLPDFVTEDIFETSRKTAEEKKKLDLSSAFFFRYEEGLCVQCMHKGSYDDEGATIEKIHALMEKEELAPDMGKGREHHEIYLSDPRRCAPSSLKTVLRIPVRKKG